MTALGGVREKLAQELADDRAFLRKLRPSLMVARAKGELPTNEDPEHGRAAPGGPQVRPYSRGAKRPSPGAGGPNPWLVAGAALALGIAVAKVIDWRGHAHPRD